MKINKANFIYFTSFFAIALLSFWLMGHYTEGDLLEYNAAYEKIRYLPMNEAYIQYFGILSSLEFGHFAITWIFSNLGVNKHILISFVNALLAMSFLIYGKNKNASFIVLIPIVFLNFYFLALYTEIERLKFSFLFFLLSMIFFENKKYFYTFAIVSILTHFQIFIIYGGFFFVYFIKQIKNTFINCRIDWKIFIITIGMLLAILILQDHLVRKLNAYLQGLQFLDLLKSLPLSLLALYYAKKKSEALGVLIVLSVAILLLGGDRLNIFVYFVFLYYGLQYKRGLNFGIFITTAYFTTKTIFFINNIFDYGRGF